MVRKFVAALAVALVAGALVAGASGFALADGPGPGRRPPQKQAQAPKGAVVAPQQFGQTGDITLGNGSLKLFVPATYYFLPAAEARAHLQRIGAHAPSGEVLGMVAPAGVRPIDDGFWAAVISTNPLGQVAEDRADRFGAPDFLDEVRAARAAPAARMEAFAAPPIHDGARHLTAWTERYPTTSTTARNIRNEQRLLGRNLVAGVTIDARASQLATVAAAAPEVARMVSFPAGQSYADYVAGTDPAPIYDLPSLLTLKTRPTPSAPTVAPTTTAAPASVAGPVPGVPAQSSGLQPVGDVAGDAAPASAFTAADVQKWLPWLGGGLVALAVIPWLVGMARRRSPRSDLREERTTAPKKRREDADPNLTPTE